MKTYKVNTPLSIEDVETLIDVTAMERSMLLIKL